MATAPNPSIPPIPQPIADSNALVFVAQALKQRVENISGYLLVLGTGSVSAAGGVFGAGSVYVLPAASTSVLGGVKVDGTTVLVTGGVLSAPGPPAATIVPLIDGAAAIGTSLQFARGDHVHPTDTSRYAASNPAGYVPKSYVDGSVGAVAAGVPAPAASLPLIDGTAAIGTSARFTRADHVHPTDTSRYAVSNPAGYVSQAYVDTAVAASSKLYAPWVLGDLPGPHLMADPFGQCVMVQIK